MKLMIQHASVPVPGGLSHQCALTLTLCGICGLEIEQRRSGRPCSTQTTFLTPRIHTLEIQLQGQDIFEEDALLLG